MKEYTYKYLLDQLLNLSKEQLNEPIKIVALDHFTAHEVVKTDGGVLLNECKLLVLDHNIYNVKTPFVYGTSSKSLDEIEAASVGIEITTKKIASKGTPLLCLIAN